MDTTSVRGSFADASNGNGETAGLVDIMAESRKEESYLTLTEPRDQNFEPTCQVADVVDLCLVTRQYSAPLLNTPNTVGQSEFQIVPVTDSIAFAGQVSFGVTACSDHTA